MALLPTCEKTWQHNVNNVVGALAAPTQSQTVLLGIKNAFIGFASSAWTVVASSNSVSVSNAGTDYWALITDLVWNVAGAAHSWIVLRQTGLGVSVSICIDLDNASSVKGSIMLSYGGFNADGTTTNRPTTVLGDDLVLKNSDFLGLYSLGGQQVWHVLQSTDGQCTRVFICLANYNLAYWAFERIKNPVSPPGTPWATPVFGVALGVNGGGADVNIYNGIGGGVTGTPPIKARITENFTMLLGQEGCASTPLNQTFTYADDDSASWWLGEVCLYNLNAPHRGLKGEVYDMWWSSMSRATGDQFPAAGSYLYTQFGDFVFRWNGTLAVIA